MNGHLHTAVVVSPGWLALALALIGAAPPARADDPPAVPPSTLRTLRLPATPDRYADVELPAHFRSAAARRFDNTPRDNPVTDAGGDPRPGPLLRHPAVGQQHRRLRLVPRAGPGVRQRAALQQGLRGQVHRPPRPQPGQPALLPARPVLLG